MRRPADERGDQGRPSCYLAGSVVPPQHSPAQHPTSPDGSQEQCRSLFMDVNVRVQKLFKTVALGIGIGGGQT